MKYLIKNLEKQQEVVEGQEMELDGEIIKIGALNPEEKTEMINEGYELGNTTVNINGKEIKLLDIEKGKELFTITEIKQYEGNFTGLWYIWRARKIMKKFNGLSEKAQKQLKAVLEQKGLDIYLEDL